VKEREERLGERERRREEDGERETKRLCSIFGVVRGLVRG